MKCVIYFSKKMPYHTSVIKHTNIITKIAKCQLYGKYCKHIVILFLKLFKDLVAFVDFY